MSSKASVTNIKKDLKPARNSVRIQSGVSPLSTRRKHKIDVLKKLKISGFLSLAGKIIIGYFYSLKYKSPQMMSRFETLDYILKNKCSIVRFGDGEVMLAAGNDLDFQLNSDELTKQMQASMKNTADSNTLVCFPDFLINSLQKEKVFDNTFWRYRHFYEYRKFWEQLIDRSYLYGSASFSRPYMAFKDSSKIGDYFEKMKKIWEDRDVLLVEGEKARLGVGNDLFDSAKSVKRILCPQSQCFDKYDEILNEIKKYSTGHLILLSIGPSASIMPRDLTPLGYQVLDIGNIDTEYEWFRAGTRERIAVKGKYFSEAQNSSDLNCVEDKRYFDQIVAKIL